MRGLLILGLRIVLGADCRAEIMLQVREPVATHYFLTTLTATPRGRTSSWAR
jgi:hypothetical protein